MPDVNSNSQTQTTGIDEASRQDAAATEATRHLTQLAKMSATAGAGTQEYIAINIPSVIALLLGFASLLALLDRVLLVIPLAGVAVALLALRQIRTSNGTQTGSGLVMGGLFLSVALGVFILARIAIEYAQTRADKQAISDVCETFGSDLKLKKFDDAYSLFSERFKARVSSAQFVEQMAGMQQQLTNQASQGGIGPVVAAHWNGLVSFNTNPDSGVETASSMMKLAYARTEHVGAYRMGLRKSGTQWKIDDLELFPPARANR